MKAHSALVRLRAWKHLLPVLVIAFFFVASRSAAYAVGVRFDSSPLGVFWQLLDPELLRTRLVETLFYLHGQPPLFNLYVGALLKVFPSHYATAAQISYLVLGIVAALALYGLLTRMGCPRWASVAVTVLMTVAPATILNENWLFYEYPVAVMLILSAFALAGFLRRQTFWPGFVFFLLIAAVIWTRSAFQIVWMLLAAGLVLVALRKRKTLVLQACLVPVLLVVALYVKNIVVFGLPSTSSAHGLNLAVSVFGSFSPADRARRVARGEISRVSLVQPIGRVEDYRRVVSLPPPTGIPVLDETALPRGTPNRNHKSYLRISSLYFRDSLHLIRAEPSAYARSVVKALKNFFQPANVLEDKDGNTARIHSYNRAFDRIVYVQTRYAAGVGLTILAAYAFALLYGLRLLYLWIRSGSLADPRLVTLLYAWLTVLYMSGTLALAVTGENQRIRFVVDPLVAVLVACAPAELGIVLKRRLVGRFGRHASPA